MINFVDITILVILILAFIDGYRKGFLASVSNLVCTIVALVAAKLFYLQGADLLARFTPVDEKVLEFVNKSTLVDNLVKANLPMLDKMGMSQAFSGDMKVFAAALIFNAVAFVATFLAVRIALGIIELVISGVMEAPGLKEVNGFFGGAISIGKAALFLLIVSSVIVPITSIINKPGVTEAINQSMVITFASKYNFVLGWLWKAVLGVLS